MEAAAHFRLTRAAPADRPGSDDDLPYFPRARGGRSRSRSSRAEPPATLRPLRPFPEPTRAAAGSSRAGGGGSGGGSEAPRWGALSVLEGLFGGLPSMLAAGDSAEPCSRASGAAAAAAGDERRGGRGRGGRHAHAHPSRHLHGQLSAMREALLGMACSGLPAQILFSDRDFDADDYEMLLRLDERVEKRGASRVAIDALPTQPVTASNVESLTTESGERLCCAVCLEEYVVDDTLRSLPCLHKFHRACIDQWLGTKASCPVCQKALH